MTNKNYEVQCDPTTGLCTAKLKVSLGKAYEIGTDRQGPLVKDRLKNGAEYLGYGFNVTTRDVSLTNRTATFTASTPTIDRYGDIIESNGWVLDNYKRNPVILFAHDSRSLPIGSAQKVFFDANGNLSVTVKFARAVGSYDLPEVILQYVNDGVLNAVSVGFIPLEFQYRFENDEEGNQKPWPSGRIYTKSELLETSIVPIPANPEALSTGKAYASALRAIEIVSHETPEYFSEPCEIAYFSVTGRNVESFGAINPVDTKEVDDDPFVFVEGDVANKIQKSNHVAAETEVLARFHGDGFLAELIGSDNCNAPVYRAFLRIAKSGPEENAAIEEIKAKKNGRRVETVIFSKKNWTLARAEKWTSAHDFKTSDPQHTSSSFRFRQFDPKECNSNSYETLTENMPKGVSLVVCSKKEKSLENSMPDKPCACKGANNAEEKSAVPFHAYPLAPSSATWDASKEMGSTKEPGDWKKMSTIVLGDEKLKGSYKLPHHKGPGAKFATVRRGVANALARLNQVKGASSADKAGGKKHLLKHMAEFHKKNGKEFDLEKFERELALIEALRDSAPVDRRKSITRELVRWIEGDSEIVLKVAKEFEASKDKALIEKYFAQEEKTDKAFSNAKINSRLKKAHASVMKAVSEIGDSHDDTMSDLGEVTDSISSVLTGEGDEDNRLGQESVASQLAQARSSVASVRKAVMLSRRRFNAYMEEAMDHLDAVCDYVGPDDSSDNDNDNDNEQEEDMDGPTYQGGDDADADGVKPPADGDDDLGKVFDEATKLIDAASKDSQGADPGNRSERSAQSDSGDEFANLLDAVSENL